MSEFTLLTKVLGIAIIIIFTYKTEFYKPVFKKISEWVSILFGLGNKTLSEIKADKVRSKSIKKMLKRAKFKGEL